MFKVIVKGGMLPQEEINAYILHTKKKYGAILPENLEMILEVDGDLFITLTAVRTILSTMPVN